MRVILAALFVFCGIALTAYFFSGWLDGSPLRMAAGVTLLVVIIFFLIAIALIVFPERERRTGANELSVAELEQQGMVVSSSFRATRAFMQEEIEDEGPYYFIELENGSVLCLNGQYLYEYQYPTLDEEGEDSESAESSVYFPSTDFTVRRHRDKGYVLDIVCRSSSLSVETTALEFPLRRDSILDTILGSNDGEIIADRSFDELRRELRGEGG